jgi:hypothetical protein
MEPPFANHDLKIVDCMDMTQGRLRNVTMNKIMGVAIVD